MTTRRDKQKRKRLAKRMAAALFGRPWPQMKAERATRLALMYECPLTHGEHMAGGWCEAAVVDALLEVLEGEPQP